MQFTFQVRNPNKYKIKNTKSWLKKLRYFLHWKRFDNDEECFLFHLKGTLMQIWKSANTLVFLLKEYVEDFTLKQLLHFDICTREICEKFVYKHSETIEYMKN